MEGRWRPFGGSTFCLLILFITCESVPMFNTGALYFMDLPSIAEYNNQRRTNIDIKPPAPRIVDVNENVRGDMRSRNLRQKLESKRNFRPSNDVKVHFFRVH